MVADYLSFMFAVGIALMVVGGVGALVCFAIWDYRDRQFYLRYEQYQEQWHEHLRREWERQRRTGNWEEWTEPL